MPKHFDALMEKSLPGSVTRIWKGTYVALRKNWRVFALLLVACVVVTLPTVLIKGQIAGWLKGTMVLGFECITLYVICSWAMRGHAEIAQKRLLNFTLRFVVLKLLITLPAHLYFLFNFGDIIWTARDMAAVSNGNVATERSIIWARAMITYPMAAFVYLLAFTWLPASLVSDGGRFLDAVKRGRVVFGHNLVWFIAGPFVLTLIFELTSVGLGELGVSILVALGGAGEGLYRLYLLFFVGAVWGAAKILCVNTMIGIVISRAYLIGEQRLEASV
ncbi:hypothetical protein ACQ0MK_10345 [Thalassospira lucentensis]|uniref:hypothetical protein n=1 Tax=Thalassospira lucentensis TaxID=168935 RepID=UPI003D2F2A04